MHIALYRRRGTVEYKKDRLMNDLKGVAADADDLLAAVADSTAEEFAGARARIEERLDEARARLADARIAVSQGASTPPTPRRSMQERIRGKPSGFRRWPHLSSSFCSVAADLLPGALGCA
jgi:hypothetical protein